MDIIRSAECFKKVGNTYKFSYLHLIIQKEGRLYLAKCSRRVSDCSELYDPELYDKKLLETENRGPYVQQTWKVLDSSYDYYVKTPDPWAYNKPDLEHQILREVEVCEILKLNPHPNIAFYGGCKSTRERVSGICFTRYTSTLLEKVNSGHLSKSDFVSSGRQSTDEVTKACLDGILAGILHLHSLGIIHNDVTPSNIMIKDQTWVLIDFDSCRKFGESLHGIKRTHGWHDPQVQTALEKNDLDAFTELKIWLTGSSVDEFLFKTG